MNVFNNRVLCFITCLYDLWYSIYAFSSFKAIICNQVRTLVRHIKFQPNDSPVDEPVNTEPVVFEFIKFIDVPNVIWSQCSINSTPKFARLPSFNSLPIQSQQKLSHIFSTCKHAFSS